MPATITNSSIPANLTQASIYAGIKSIFTGLGYTPFAEFVSGGTNFVVYRRIFDATKQYSRVFCRIGVTSISAISQAIGSDFDIATNTLVNASTTITSGTPVAATPIDLRAFKSQSGEYDLVHVRQGTTPFIMLGWLRPATLNNIDEIAYTAALMFNNANGTGLIGTALNPYSNLNFSAFVHVNLAGTNHFGLRDVIPNLVILNNGYKSIFGLTSDDFAIGAGNGLNILESVGNRQMIISRGVTESSVFLG
ncbi:hypothetical protein [Fortiea contorta]|uniref:hypothetical protein n=1 Tax=Fortiea contorta TaxID=1892405 RepID=UPI0003451AA0|nr:hypothetical protein [Fortiea contorta]